MVRVGNQGRSRAAARGFGASAIALFLVSILTSCNLATVGGSTAPADIDVLDKVRSADIMPRQPEAIGGGQPNAGQRAKSAVYEGTEVTDVGDSRLATQPASGGSGYDLNFENTPVATVAKVVLGDILQTGYTIDPRVQGTVSLVSVRPVAKSDIVFVLESALRLSGVVLLKDAAGYKLTPLGDAVGAGRVDSAAASPEPGYGVSVVPLQYVSAQTILKLMDSFATKPGSVRADPTRNILLIQGTGAERRTAVDTALSFDVDWMRGQSVGIYPVSNSAPEPIIAELEKIMDSGDSGLSASLVKFQPMSRMNAILVVSRKPALLQTAATWIRRLDQADRLSLNSSSSNSSSSNSGFASRGSSSTGGTSAFGALQQNSANGSGNNGSGSGGNGSSSSGLDSRTTGGNGQPIMQNVRITPDAVNNELLIYADQPNYKIIETTLEQLDRPSLQVAIDATIAEVTLTNELTYGVQFYLQKQGVGSLLNTQSTSAPSTSTTTSTDSSGNSIVSTATSALINRAFPGFNFLIGSESNPKAILDALHAVTSVKVLSNPSLVVINNQAATLQVGDVVPVSTGSATVLSSSNTVVNTIDYRNTGIILRVSPRINANGGVRLDVEQEISNVTPATSASLTPTISERKVKS
jgi:general secretion pathway protein D